MNHLSRNILTLRRDVGLSTEEAASRGGLEPSLWAAVESGDVLPSAYQTSRMAAALGVDVALVAADRDLSQQPDRRAVRFRRGEEASRLGSKARLALMVAARIGRIAGELGTLLGHTLPVFKARAVPLKGADAWRQGYRLGSEARLRFKACIPPGPVVDIVSGFNRLGIHVAEADLGDPDIHAAAIWERDSIPVILLSTASRARGHRSRRSILAHELCHLLHDADETHVVHTLTRPSERELGVEKRANAFAPAFLAPRSMCLKKDTSDLELCMELVTHWGFSNEGAVWHTRNLLQLGQERALTLLDTLDAPPRVPDRFRVTLTPRSDDLPAEPTGMTGGLVMELVREALEASHITRGRAAEILRTCCE